ncbi:MAG: lysozyme inhibitor LprI family protein [Bilophila sp.]
MNMPKWLVAGFLTCSLLGMACGQALALSDADYKKLLTSKDFQESDNSLKQVLADAQKQLAPEDFAKIEKLQKNWLIDRDAECTAMKGDGMSETEAWTVIFDSQTEFIAGRAELYALNRSKNPVEGAYEYDTSTAGNLANGLLSLRAEQGKPDNYEVTIEIVCGPEDAPRMCSYLGVGELKDNLITANTEDGDASLKIVLNGKKAIVTASKGANDLCAANVILDGTYGK